jgi:uncharacterized delta-60 repeat protein
VTRSRALGQDCALGAWLAVVLAVLGSALAVCSAAAAASWHPQSSFGDRGVAALPARDTWSLLAPGPDGSLFAAGGVTCTAPPSMNPYRCAGTDKALLVARISAHGGPVPGFGRGGVLAVPAIYAPGSTRMFAVPEGKLLIVGEDRAGDLTLVRLTAGGEIDRTFGRGGVARYGLPDREHNRMVAGIEPNGDTLAVYQQTTSPTELGRTVFVRLLPSGALDESFGKGGFLDASGGPAATIGPVGSLGGMALAPDGSVLLAEESLEFPSGRLEWGVEQLSPAGATIPGFGTGGLAVAQPGSVELSPEAACQGLYALPDGGVEVAFAGTALVNNPHAFLGQEFRNEMELFRFTSSGAPDPTFGRAGKVTIGAQYETVVLAPGGETLTVGGAGGELALGGVLASGATDPAMGGARGVSVALHLGGVSVDAPLVLQSAGGMSVLVNAADVVRVAD